MYWVVSKMQVCSHLLLPHWVFGYCWPDPRRCFHQYTCSAHWSWTQAHGGALVARAPHSQPPRQRQWVSGWQTGISAVWVIRLAPGKLSDSAPRNPSGKTKVITKYILKAPITYRLSILKLTVSKQNADRNRWLTGILKGFFFSFSSLWKFQVWINTPYKARISWQTHICELLSSNIL